MTNKMQYDTIQYNTIQYYTIHHNTIIVHVHNILLFANIENNVNFLC